MTSNPFFRMLLFFFLSDVAGVASVTDVVKEGQRIPVKLLEVDKMGRLNLSYIDAIDPNGGGEEESRPPRRDDDHRRDRSRG